MESPAVAFAALAAAFALATLVAVLLHSARLHRLRLLAEQALAGQRAEAEILRATLSANERAAATGAYSGDCDRLVQLMAITYSGDRDHLQHVAL